MGRMTVTIDDVLVDDARRVLGLRTKRETIEAALKEVVRRARLGQIAGRCGKVALGLSRQELLERRVES